MILKNYKKVSLPIILCALLFGIVIIVICWSDNSVQHLEPESQTFDFGSKCVGETIEHIFNIINPF